VSNRIGFVDYIDCLFAVLPRPSDAGEATARLRRADEPGVRCVCSHDSDSGGNLEGFLVSVEGNVSLLVSGGSHEGVNTGDLDVVELFASLLDGGFLGSTVTDEDEGVETIFAHLDGGLGGQRVLDDGVGVEDVFVVLNTLSEGNGLLGLSLGDGSSEGSVGPDLSLEVGVASLLDSSSGGFGLTDRIEWLGTLLPTICVYAKPEREVSAAHT
jgi:hypothetical protein